MGSIRPLITITIRVVVGAYLYVKINEGPVQMRAGSNSNSNQSPDGVPPLAAASKGASLAAESAPAWPAATPAVAPQPVSAPPAAATTTAPSPTTTNSSTP